MNHSNLLATATGPAHGVRPVRPVRKPGTIPEWTPPCCEAQTGPRSPDVRGRTVARPSVLGESTVRDYTLHPNERANGAGGITRRDSDLDRTESIVGSPKNTREYGSQQTLSSTHSPRWVSLMAKWGLNP